MSQPEELPEWLSKLKQEFSPQHLHDVEELWRKKNPPWLPLIAERDGAARLVRKLPNACPPQTIVTDRDAPVEWAVPGLFYLRVKRFHEAESIFLALYDHMSLGQEKTDGRTYKGQPLMTLSACYWVMGFPALAKRYSMLHLCEAAVHTKGRVPAETSGTYPALVERHGLADSELTRYAKKAYKLSIDSPHESVFAEWILQQLDQDWMTEYPSVQEAGVYRASRHYIRCLMAMLGDRQGQSLERLAAYLLSCMPGCRTSRRPRTPSTDYDVVCSMDGFDLDFRSELGRYFVCECKDWSKPADFSTFAKFCRVLDSVKSRFGILFSMKGISGQRGDRDAGREQLKVFQDRGMVIVVVDQADLKRVADGANFISLLRRKYEQVRLDLRKKPQFYSH